jgi:hypothetical protein
MTTLQVTTVMDADSLTPDHNNLKGWTVIKLVSIT